MVQCEWCGETFTPESRSGPVPRYCRRAHRQRAYEARRLAAVAAPVEVEPGETLAELVAAHGRFLELLGRAQAEGIAHDVIATAIGQPVEQLAPEPAPVPEPDPVVPVVEFPKRRTRTDPKTTNRYYVWEHGCGVVLEIRRRLFPDGKRRWEAHHIGSPVPRAARGDDPSGFSWDTLAELDAGLAQFNEALGRTR